MSGSRTNVCAQVLKAGYCFAYTVKQHYSPLDNVQISCMLHIGELAFCVFRFCIAQCTLQSTYCSTAVSVSRRHESVEGNISVIACVWGNTAAKHTVHYTQLQALCTLQAWLRVQ